MNKELNKKKFEQYINNLNFNFINKYLHSIRYKYLYEITEKYENKIKRKIKILDIGCGHGQLFDILNSSFDIDYIGIDKSPRFNEYIEKKFGKFKNFKYINDNVHDHKDLLNWADMVISLETLEHIPEKSLKELITEIGKAKPDVFFSSVPNEVGPIVWVKNLYSILVRYDRHLEYSWKDTFFSGLGLFHYVRQHEAGHRGFDWRNLSKLINASYKIEKIYSSPYKYIPKPLSPSIYFLCTA